MTTPLVETYNKRGIERNPARLPEFLQTEFGNIERALKPWTQFGANFVTPLMFGGRPGGPDASRAINRALATGYPVDLLGLDWYANNLATDVVAPCVFSSVGMGRIIKNANGDLLTLTGRNAQLRNVIAVGDAATPIYTGDNFVLTGNDPVLVNCGSRYAYGRALKATGQRVQVYGSGDIWATADTTASGFDIELGVSGTATLYHQLVGIISTNPSGRGGILLTDCGSQTILGGEYGKLSILAGTGPAGVNGGQVIGSRITGAVTVNVSNATFSANQFSSNSPITLGTGTTNITIDVTNTIGSTVTNNGNDNNVLIRQVSAGSTITLRYGDDASSADMEILPTSSAYFRMPAIRVNNANHSPAGSYTIRNNADSGAAATWLATSADNVQMVAASGSLQHFVATGQQHQFLVNAVEQLRVSGAGTSLLAGLLAPTTAKTATFTAAATDYTLLCDATSGAITANLPAAASNAGRIYLVKKVDASANAVTLDGDGAETIDGAATYALTVQWQSVTVQCNGTGWFIL